VSAAQATIISLNDAARPDADPEDQVTLSDQVGERRTRQRDAILRAIRDAHGPLTVNAIHERARAEINALGLATVYRTIRLFLDAGEIRAVTLLDGQVRYESADLEHHLHFRCRGCERVFDLPICPCSIPNGATLPEGFYVDDHEVILHGLCPDCLGKRRKDGTSTT
jgi:Fur family ferric uptake transcriptional regulator